MTLTPFVSHPEITIIVPVYNVSEYLVDCLYSIQAQSYENFEVLVINDESTDNSAEICQSFAKQDHRFKYFSVSHRGLSEIRNFGLKRARGRYISFIDSDDKVSPHFLDIMHNVIENEHSDIVVCQVKKFIHGTSVVFTKTEKVRKSLVTNSFTFFQASLFLNTSDQTLLYQGAIVTNKLYKREIVEGVDFKTTLGAEDEIFLYDIISRVKKVVYLDSKLLYYRVRYNSLSHNLEFPLNHLGSRFSLLVRCHNLELEKMLRTAIVQKTLDVFLLFITSKEITSKEYKRLYPFLKLSLYWKDTINLEMLNPNIRRGLLKRLIVLLSKMGKLKQEYFCFFSFGRKVLLLPQMYLLYRKLRSIRPNLIRRT